jgi:hypothetical protein
MDAPSYFVQYFRREPSGARVIFRLECGILRACEPRVEFFALPGVLLTVSSVAKSVSSVLSVAILASCAVGS